MSAQTISVDGSTCTSLHGSLTCLTRGDTAGLTIAVGASLLSLGSVVFAFFFILVDFPAFTCSTGFRLFYNPMDILVFALLFADLVQAIGGLLSLKWIQDGIVQVGTFCNTQGILKTFGETGVALTTLLIAIYTFIGVSTGKSLKSMKVTVALVVGIWVFIGILIGVGYAANHGRYMLPVPYWCWVGTKVNWRLAAEYLWMWISLFISCLLYIPLFLWMRGNLIFHESVWYAWSFEWKFSDPDRRSTRRKALVMLIYPIVYCVCILPLSIVRWRMFYEEDKYGATTINSKYTFTVITVFGLSGFLNVILVFTTKPNLGLFGRHEATSGRPPSPNQFRPENEPDAGGYTK